MRERERVGGGGVREEEEEEEEKRLYFTRIKVQAQVDALTDLSLMTNTATLVTSNEFRGT